jgi:glutathione S-transferase
MKLYDDTRAPNPRRVRMYLAEKGISVPLEATPVVERANRTEEFRKINSLQQIPVLELDDGTCIAETLAICRYFEVENPEPALFGKSALEQANVEMWNRRIEFQLLSTVGAYWRHCHAFTKALPGRIEEAGLQGKELAEVILAWLNDEIAGREYIAGDSFTVADITALCVIDFAAFVGVAIPDDATNLKEWHARISARPSAAA